MITLASRLSEDINHLLFPLKKQNSKKNESNVNTNHKKAPTDKVRAFFHIYFRTFILYSYLYFVQDIPDNTFVLDNVLDTANSDTHVHNHTGISLSST